MFDVIIPIRSNSIGLKNKNVLKFDKKINLTNFTLNKLIKVKKIRKIFILTDSEKYKKKIIKNKKIDKNFIRNKKISKSNSTFPELISAFLKNYYNHEKNQNFLILQVTSPLLTKIEIEKTIDYIEQNNISSLVHVTPALESPFEMVEKTRKKWNFLIKKRLINRQNYKRKFFFITGSLFFFKKSFYEKFNKIYNLQSKFYVVDRINFIDIDDKFTFELAKKNIDLKIRN